MKKSVNKTIKLIIMLSLVFLIGFSLLGCRHVVKKEQQVVIGTVIDKYSTVYTKGSFHNSNNYIVISYNNKNYKFYDIEYYNKYQIGDKVKCTYEKTYFDNNSYEYNITNIIEKVK